MVNYYKNNPEQSQRPRLARKQKIRELKNKAKDVPCMDCGIKYPPYVMDFDHKGDKVFEIAAASSAFMSLEKLVKEINKCDVACSNCHRIRTFKNEEVLRMS